jgi:hypothetical protein
MRRFPLAACGARDCHGLTTLSRKAGGITDDDDTHLRRTLYDPKAF